MEVVFPLTVIMHRKQHNFVWSYRNIYIADWSGLFKPWTADVMLSVVSQPSHTSQSPSHMNYQTDSVLWSADLQRTVRLGGGSSKPIQLSDGARTSWENLEGGGCAFRRDFNDNDVTVAIFAANNNTNRLLENTSNNSDSTHTYILIITLYTNTHEHNIQQHCHAFWYEFCDH